MVTIDELIYLLFLQTQKIVWPDKLKRFPVEEVMKRARSRKDETWYDVLKNNCEHFITWSICGLKASLQVKSWCLTAREFGYSALTGIYDCGRNIVKEKAIVPLLAANVSDEVAAYISENALYLGYGLAIAMEAGLACYELDKAFKYCKTWGDKTAKFVDIVAKATCRLGFGPVGSWVGAALFPATGPLASLIGGAIGAGVGHLVGAVT